MCVRESRRPSNRPIGMGHVKEALHLHYALSVIFGHFLIQKSLNFLILKNSLVVQGAAM